MVWLCTVKLTSAGIGVARSKYKMTYVRPHIFSNKQISPIFNCVTPDSVSLSSLARQLYIYIYIYMLLTFSVTFCNSRLTLKMDTGKCLWPFSFFAYEDSFYICDRLPENRAQRGMRNIEKRSIDFLKMYCFKPTEGNG